VFNFWEPLHYITHGSGFQTWEATPQFAIRSWTYIFLHFPFTVFGKLFSTSKVRSPLFVPLGSLTLEQRPSFFAVRLTLGFICSLCEAQVLSLSSGARQ
jgi:alpha-1,2-mannosyltransferase